MIIRYKIWSREQEIGECADPVVVTVETTGNDLHSRLLAGALARVFTSTKKLTDDAGNPIVGIRIQTVDFYAEQKHNGIIDIC